MLTDVKTVIEVIGKLFDLKNSERARISGLLDQISDELDDLASIWTDIAQAVNGGNASPGDVEDLLIRQRTRYQALVKFADHQAHIGRLSPLNTSGGHSMFSLVEDALSMKGELFQLTIRAKYGDSPMDETPWDPDERRRDLEEGLTMNPQDPSLSETDKIIARYYAKNRQKFIQALEDHDANRSLVRASAVEKLRLRTGVLQALAGEFRTVATLYKSGEVR